MEDLFSIHPGILGQQVMATVVPSFEDASQLSYDINCDDHHTGQFDLSNHLIKAQISGHPCFPSLFAAYIDCRKVGAPAEMVSQIEEIAEKRYPSFQATGKMGTDPELDDFMDSYYRLLVRYKEELSKPFEEATKFINGMESQLINLCKAPSNSAATASTGVTVTAPGNSQSDDAAVSSGEDVSCGDIDLSDSHECGPRLADNEIKEMLLKKYSGHLSSLRKEFAKKRKKGKLPKDSRLALLDWWNSHYRWPYPTEEEKTKLAEQTGLGQKQISNWFINQRKRHWKPAEDVRLALMDDVASRTTGTMLYFDRGTFGP